MLKLSIIIPTLNEAANLNSILKMLGREHEIVVVEGGSAAAGESALNHLLDSFESEKDLIGGGFCRFFDSTSFF